MDDRPAEQLWVSNWAVDADGRASHADPFWRQFTGQSDAQAQDPWIDAAHPDDRGRISAAWTTAFQRREPCRLEFRLRRFDGVYRWVLAVGAPRFHEDGSFQGYLGSLVDIETRRQAEEALRESEERMRAVVQSYAQALWETNPQGQVTPENLTWCDYTGQTPGAFLGAGWLDAVHPDDREDTDRRWRDAVASRKVYEAEYRLKRKGEGWRWTSAHATPVFNQDGSVRKWVGVNIDINARKLAQEALRESERRMRLAQDAAHAGAWEWNLSTNANIWSENLWGLFGLSATAGPPSFESWIASIHPDDRDRISETVRAAAKAGEEYEIQWRVNLPDDRARRWLLSRGRPIFGANGRPERYIGIVFDITERKNAEDALAESERRYRMLYETLRDPFVRTGMDGRILEFNALYQEMLGYSAEELLQLTYVAITPERWHDMEAAIVREQILARGYSDVYEKEYRRKDGTVVPIELRAILGRDSGGAPHSMWAIVRDVTARKRAEAELRDGQQRVQLATQAAEVGIWEWNLDTDEVRYDEQMFRIYGMAPTADHLLHFREWADCVLPEDLDQQTELLRAHAGMHGVHSREFRIRRKDSGEIRVIQAIETTREGENGRIKWLVGTNKDITERKRNEEALREADRRKDEFIATLAHELRNPLAPIHNGVHVLKAAAARRGENADARVLDMMERQVRQLVRLVDDLLEIARIASGKIELRREPTALSTVIASALETSQPLIERAKHRVVLNAPFETLRVYGDPARLSQALSNLVNNAAKYTSPGGCIDIRVEPRDGEVFITVCDNGRGLPPEALPHVFELFAQFNGSHEGGLGIGLALVRKLIELHGGTIEARSAGLGKGSEFVVRLPLLADGDCAEVDKAAASTSPRLKKALVIDDDHDVADTLALLLESLGATVRVAYSGETGAGEASEFDPDVVFLDLGMPGQDGFETARRIRSAESGRKKTLVALSGWGQEEDRKRSREAGFDAHLTKPASIEALRAFLDD